MDIVVKSPLMADKIKDLLDNKAIDGLSFSFVEKNGINQTFHAVGENIADAAAIAKKVIKSSDFGKGIYFTVENK